jgi:hypothetical protein
VGEWAALTEMSKTTETGAMKRKLHIHLEGPVLVEHAQEYTGCQNWIVYFVHWLETSGIFLTYQEKGDVYPPLTKIIFFIGFKTTKQVASTQIFIKLKWFVVIK